MRKIVILASLLIALFAFFSLSIAEEGKKAEEEQKFEYVGAKKCKGCHLDIYKSWEKSGHAKAWEVLSEEEQKKEECIVCHITGKDEEGELITGVGCESCHGPGSEYKSPKIKSRKKWKENPEEQMKLAKAAGLNPTPDAEGCKNCHKKEGNPNFKPFDFEKMKDMVHPVEEEG